MATKVFEVFFTAGAKQDLEALYDFIAEYDSPERADYVLDEITDQIKALAHFPERGSYPKELLDLGIKEFRQIAFKPYRVIYRTTATQVIIYLIADDRRNLQATLNRRLLRA
jgi:toxin ParE1/3/4